MDYAMGMEIRTTMAEAYKGDSKHVQNGQGELTRKDGSIYIGAFENNKFQGGGKLIEADGTVFRVIGPKE